MIFKSIQYISAKNKPLHRFLKLQGLNNYSHLFFLDQDETYYMISISGNLYKFIPYGETFLIKEIEDKSLLEFLLSLAKEAIDYNQECLRDTYEAIIYGRKSMDVSLF